MIAVKVKPGARRAFGSALIELGRVVESLGNNGTAKVLGVSPSLVSRWLKKTEPISSEKRRAIVDLDFVLNRALQIFTAEQLSLWLTGNEPHLGGARPIDVLRLRGPLSVVRALDAVESGAFA